MKNERLFAKIPNNIISIKKEEDFTEEGSLLKIIKDDKIIRVLYELYIGSDFRNICVTSIGRLITLCGYKSDKDTVKSFKSLLNALNDNEVIKIENEIGKINEAIIINVEKLRELEEKYTIITEEEMNSITSIGKSNREINTLLKEYFFIKMMSHKREDGDLIELHYDSDDFEPQTAMCGNDYITKFTGISNVKKVNDKLVEGGLLLVGNIGKKYTKPDKSDKNESCNVYAVVSISENPQEELKASMRKYKVSLNKKGFSITNKDYKNNNRTINGLKGSLVKKENKGTITKEEQKKLDKIRDDEKHREEEREILIKSDNTYNANSMGLSDYSSNSTENEEIYDIEYEEKSQRRGFNAKPKTNKNRKYYRDEDDDDYIDSLL